MEAKRILVLTDGIWPYVIGGMQKHSYYLCKHLAKRRIDVILVHTADIINDEVRNVNCFTDEEKRFITSIVVEKPFVRKYPGHYLRQAYLYSKAVYNVVKDQPPVDFIIAKGLTSWYLVGHGRRTAPIGINIHGYEYLQKKADIRSFFESVLLSLPLTYINRKADYVFSYGGKITQYILSLGINHQRIIESTAAIEKEWLAEGLSESKTPRTFVFLGRYERRKGIQELSDVIERSAGKFDFKFHFIGPIPEDKQLKLSNVYYHGTVKDMHQLKLLLQEAEVLICPSYSEGMPNVILEAMGNGCAVIATDVGAVSLLVSKKTGWLIQEASNKELESAFIDALTIPAEELLEKRYNAMQTIRKEFLWDKVSEGLLRKINTALEIRP